MSKRYGRNQKKKHLMRISELEAAYKMQGGLLAEVSRKKSAAEQTIADMIETIERAAFNSIAIPVKTVFGGDERDSLRCEICEPPPPVSQQNAPIMATYNTVELYALRAFVEENRDGLSKSVHLKYSAGKHSAYMMSEKALADMPEGRLIEWILPEIAKELVRRIKN